MYKRYTLVSGFKTKRLQEVTDKNFLKNPVPDESFST